jgi:two-component system chemotaxis response regulator CheB
MEKVRVLVVDDSVVYRTQIRAALADLPFVEVVGAASNGRLALERLGQTATDLVVLDLEMPEMDGIATIRAMRERGITAKVLVFSSVSKRGAEVTLEALRLGAEDFITKPGADDLSGDGSAVDPKARIRDLLAPKIRALFPVVETVPAPSPTSTSTLSSTYPRVLWELFQPEIVVIGSSTGGPTVLEKIFAQLSGSLRCPILIAQHMPPVFTATLAERIGRLSGIEAREARANEPLENKIYLAPGDFHMTLRKDSDGVRLALDRGPQVNSVRPAVDPLFESAAKIFGRKCLGIVLTGMGADGKVGAEHIKRAGGPVLIQNRESCVVFGMPGAVFDSGAYDRIISPDELAGELRQKALDTRIDVKKIGGTG